MKKTIAKKVVSEIVMKDPTIAPATTTPAVASTTPVAPETVIK